MNCYTRESLSLHTFFNSYSDFWKKCVFAVQCVIFRLFSLACEFINVSAMRPNVSNVSTVCIALTANKGDNGYSLSDRVSETLTLRHKPRPRTAIVPSFGFTGFFYA